MLAAVANGLPYACVFACLFEGTVVASLVSVLTDPCGVYSFFLYQFCFSLVLFLFFISSFLSNSIRLRERGSTNVYVRVVHDLEV